MERWGLVAQMEQELERMLSLGQLPPSGELPSEQTLSRRYGVSRTTVRAAMVRLASRGLVVQHPRRRLLEGFLELKRDTTLELLIACRQQASEAELEPLRVEQEFNLLREAASVARRPGHFLLLQSLERAFRGMEEWLLPHLDGQALCQWAQCALYALDEADAQRLRTELAPLLVACDERLLASLTPAPERAAMPEAGTTLVELHGEEGSPQQPPVEPLPGAVFQHLEAGQHPDEQSPAREPQEESLRETALSSLEASEPPGDNHSRPAPQQQHLPGVASHHPPDAQQPCREMSGPEAAGESLPGAALPNRYHCHTGVRRSPPTSCPVPEPLTPGSQQLRGGGAAGEPPSDLHAGREQPLASPTSLPLLFRAALLLYRLTRPSSG
jgi:hypothetical protein